MTDHQEGRTLRVATYTRISTDEEHQPYSLEAQAQRLDAYIRSQEDWEMVRQFSDQMSGSTLERPALTRALAEARAGRFDLLLVYRVDRLSRSVRGLAQILEDLDRAKVVFRSATEPFDTGSPAGRMMVQMLGVFAEFERATIIDRVVAGMERKAARGGWNGGERPFGYLVDAESGGLAVAPEEAPLVPVIFDLYLNKRLGSRAIASWLNERGHRTKNGKHWSFMSVLTVLRNRAYVGEVHFRGTDHPAAHPALVEQAVFESVQELLEERGESHAKRRTNSSEYLLGGLVVCQRCGHHFVGTAAKGNRYRYRYYSCNSRIKYGKEACDAERLPADELDQAVLQSLLETYQQSDLLEAAVIEARRRLGSGESQRRAELEAVESEIRTAEEALDRYFRAFEQGALSQALAAPRLEALGEKLRGLRAREMELRDEIESQTLPAPTSEDFEAARAGIQLAIETGGVAQRKALLQELVAEIRVTSRASIQPVFRVIAASKVREETRMVRLAGIEPAASCSAGTRY